MIPTYHCTICGDQIDGLQARLSSLRYTQAQPMCRDCISVSLGGERRAITPKAKDTDTMYVIKQGNTYWTGSEWTLRQRDALRLTPDDKAKVAWLVTPASAQRFVKLTPKAALPSLDPRD